MSATPTSGKKIAIVSISIAVLGVIAFLIAGAAGVASNSSLQAQSLRSAENYQNS
jgi:hypothetical protein